MEELGLSVRLTAPQERRIAYYARIEGVNEREATRAVQRIDAQQRSFILRFFGCDVDDPSNYDLVVNTTGFDADECAKLIAHAFYAKFGKDAVTRG